nr:MAG TPA: hypothetical protein [Caudoviricetes sp.]
MPFLHLLYINYAIIISYLVIYVKLFCYFY